MNQSLFYKFLRYEIPFSEAVSEEAARVSGPLPFTEEDLAVLLERLNAVTDYEACLNEWARPMFSGPECVRKLYPDFSGRNTRKRDLFCRDTSKVCERLFLDLRFDSRVDRETDILSGEDEFRETVRKYAELLACIIANRARTVGEYDFPDWWKEEIVLKLWRDNGIIMHSGNVPPYTDEEKRKLAEIIDEACEEHDEIALWLRGSQRYRGGWLYEQDYRRAAEDMEKLISAEYIPGDGARRLLMDIYYHGRANNGEPEYGKMIPLLLHGAVFNEIESLKIIQTMYETGTYLPQSDWESRQLLRNIYKTALDRYTGFIGNDTDDLFYACRKLADRAIKNGLANEARYYLLQARFALGMMKERDADAEHSVEEALLSLKNTADERQSDPEQLDDSVQPDLMEYLYLPLSYSAIGWLGITEEENRYRLEIRRGTRRDDDYDNLMLLTVVEQDYCDACTEIVLYVNKNHVNGIRCGNYNYDSVYSCFNEQDELMVQLCLNNLVQAEFCAPSFELRIPKKRELHVIRPRPSMPRKRDEDEGAKEENKQTGQ